MAEARSLTASEHGAHPAGVSRQRTMPDRIDAAVHPVQPADANPAVDRVRPEAGLGQLATAHHAVLARCEARDGGVRIGLVELCPHLGV